MVLYLKENHQVALYVACGDLTDVTIDSEVLKIQVEDLTMLSVLSDGKRELERALSWQGLQRRVEVVQKIIPPKKEEEDINTLKVIFKDKLIVKD